MSTVDAQHNSKQKLNGVAELNAQIAELFAERAERNKPVLTIYKHLGWNGIAINPLGCKVLIADGLGLKPKLFTAGKNQSKLVSSMVNYVKDYNRDKRGVPILIKEEIVDD